LRLALACAPAGFGKTTLLADWHDALRDRGVAAAWLSLDEHDDEPRRFLANVTAAIRSVRPETGRETEEILRSGAGEPPESAAECLVRELSASGEPLALFLDDYHEVRHEAVHGAVDTILRYAPASFLLVLGTREPPPLPVERLRLRGELLEVGWEALAFSDAETAEYLRAACGASFPEGQVEALHARTEGWITALQLAALAFAGGSDAERVVSSLSGEQRAVSAWLMEGVFRRQPPRLRRFLLRSSVLERLSAPLCDALSGEGDSRRLIEEAERKNLFIFALDDRRSWFRYHPLFSGFLRERLRTEMPGEEEGLFAKAGEWCVREGLLTEAVRYALAGRSFRRAARLLETAGRDLFRHGEFRELHEWIASLPEEEIRRSPVLSTLDGWALGYLGEFGAARCRMEWADEALDRGGDRGGAAPGRPLTAARAELAILRSVLGIIQRDEPDTEALPADVADAFPPEETALRGYASVALGFARRREGDLPGALARFREAEEATNGPDDPLVHLNARLNEGIVLHLMGREGEAEAVFRDSLDTARARRWHRTIGASFLRYGLALVLYDRNRLGEALEELSEAIAPLRGGGAFGFLGMALVERARVLDATGDRERAAADLSEARRVAREHAVERVAFRASLLEARMAVREGRLARAAECLEEGGSLRSRGEPSYPEKRELFLVERIRLMVARHEGEEPARLAARGAKEALASGRVRQAVEFLVLQAAALLALERKEEALAVFEEALSLASAEGMLRPFVDAGRQVLPLLRHFEYAQDYHTTVLSILWALEERGGGDAGRDARPEGAERFHVREVQILGLIARGLRNREIAGRLLLTEETVKWYLKRLFCKLSVRTRTEAIAKGREAGLIP
jgi:LuxR family maltose regulon positive regulatory protein